MENVKNAHIYETHSYVFVYVITAMDIRILGRPLCRLNIPF